jgi:regulator of protease activity HflC (stomatin/prohibitin superfamily)
LRQRLRDQREKSAIRARLAQQGTLTTSGTPLLILGEVAANQEIAIQDAVRSANMQAASARAQGTMGLWEAESTSAALTNKSIAAGIEGISSAAKSFASASNDGAFTSSKSTGALTTVKGA